MRKMDKVVLKKLCIGLIVVGVYLFILFIFSVDLVDLIRRILLP